MGRVLVAGILNVTPDSFSDGGRFVESNLAIAEGLRMWGLGADQIDVGGESTRPGSGSVSPQEELARVIPVIEALAMEGVTVSVDTSKPEVAKAACSAGATIVNDVNGLRAEGMVEVIAAASAGAVIMHMRGDPSTMQKDTTYSDLITEVYQFLERQINIARAAGIKNIMADPGIGFGKSAQQCSDLIRNLDRFRSLGVPLYVGASRKSFLGKISGVASSSDRVIESLAAVASAQKHGVGVVRVHDVAETIRFLRVLESIENG